MVDVGILKQPLNALLLGVGDEHLPKVVVAHQPDELHHPLVIELIEDVIQQQNGFVANLLIVIFKLGQTYGDHERFLLALRPELLQRVTVKAKFQVVLMDAHIGVT